MAMLSTLKQWSTNYGWQARAVEYDTQIEERKNLETEQRRRAVLEEGLALDFERVAALKKLATYLLNQIETPGKVWLKETRQVGKGEDAEIVTVKRRFNAPLIEQFRGVLDDIAKEKGERKHVMDIKLIREEAESIAHKLGLDVADVLVEVENILMKGKGA